MGAVLAIDLGARKTGFAVADATRVAVQPLETVRLPEGSDELLAHVAGLLEERDVDVLLVGLPLSDYGEEPPRARASRAFAERLRARFPACDVRLHDEHLTTREAEALLREAGYRGKEARERRDAWSALVLLRDWIASGEP